MAIDPSLIVLAIATRPLPLAHKMDLGKDTWQPKVLAAAAGLVCAVTVSAGFVSPVETDVLVFRGRRSLCVTLSVSSTQCPASHPVLNADVAGEQRDLPAGSG